MFLDHGVKPATDTGCPAGLTASEAAASEADIIAINVSQILQTASCGSGKILSDTWNKFARTVRPCAPLASMSELLSTGFETENNLAATSRLLALQSDWKRCSIQPAERWKEGLPTSLMSGSLSRSNSEANPRCTGSPPHIGARQASSLLA